MEHKIEGEGNMRTWKEVYANAKEACSICRCCIRCNGQACRGETPGPGGKGSGESFVRNVEMLKRVHIHMDTIGNIHDINTSTYFFNHPVSLPVYAAPISGIRQNYGADLEDGLYTDQLIKGCLQAGTIAFSGDGMYLDMFEKPAQMIKAHGGYGVCTMKPWVQEHLQKRIDIVNETKPLAVASDIDASGLTNLRQSVIPVSFKSVEELQAIKAQLQVPFIIKGIMTVEGAKKAVEAKADGIIVSNHGGRVLDDCLSGIEVLPEIVEAVKGKVKIFVDGGFRSGNDVFKALALGADGVLIGRPLSHAVIGGGSEGVSLYLNKIQMELKEAMAMSGCSTLADITKDKVVVKF